METIWIVCVKVGGADRPTRKSGDLRGGTRPIRWERSRALLGGDIKAALPSCGKGICASKSPGHFPGCFRHADRDFSHEFNLLRLTSVTYADQTGFPSLAAVPGRTYSSGQFADSYISRRACRASTAVTPEIIRLYHAHGASREARGKGRQKKGAADAPVRGSPHHSSRLTKIVLPAAGLFRPVVSPALSDIPSASPSTLRRSLRSDCSRSPTPRLLRRCRRLGRSSLSAHHR